MFCLYKLWGGSWLGDWLGGQGSPASRDNYGVRDTITAPLPVWTTLKGANTFLSPGGPSGLWLVRAGGWRKLQGEDWRVNYVSFSWHWRWWVVLLDWKYLFIKHNYQPARMDNTDQSGDSPNQPDGLRTNERAVQGWASLNKRVERNRIMNRFQQKPAITV